MAENPTTFLVVVDESPEFDAALRYAAGAARRAQVPVTLLSVIEPSVIAAWGGVERAMDDEAFAQARAQMASHEVLAQNLSGAKPVCLYVKGERRAVLMEQLEKLGAGVVLVLGSGGKEGGNALIQYLTSDKGLRKLHVPLVIVPQVKA